MQEPDQRLLLDTASSSWLDSSLAALPQRPSGELIAREQSLLQSPRSHPGDAVAAAEPVTPSAAGHAPTETDCPRVKRCRSSPAEERLLQSGLPRSSGQC